MKHPQRILALGALAALTLVAACDDDDETSPSNTATVRFVNAINGGEQSLTVNGTLGTGVAYQAYGSCQTVTSGSTTLAFAPTAGGGSTTTIPTQTFASGGHYTVIATGTTADPTYLFLNDAVSTPSTGNANLRVINAVDVDTPFDVYVVAPGGALSTANKTNVTFNTSQSYFTVQSGSRQVTFTDVGTVNTLGTTGTVNFTNQTSQTIVVTPSATIGGLLTWFSVPNCT
jgi:hypothetical protein